MARTVAAQATVVRGLEQHRQGADGCWHGYVSVRRADVVRRVSELEEQRDAGIRLAGGGRTVTVEQWLDHWLTAITVRYLGLETFAGILRQRQGRGASITPLQRDAHRLTSGAIE